MPNPFHPESHPLARKTVRIKLCVPNVIIGDVDQLEVEDWWDRVYGASWMFAAGNPACLTYAARSTGIPIDNEVLYGKTPGGRGMLIHISELAEEPTEPQP